MKTLRVLAFIACALTISSLRAGATTVTFTTFVSASSISAVEGQDNTIAYNYAGNMFVGSVYVGTNNDQLFSTNTSGGGVTKFGAPIPGNFSGEVVVGASLGQAGFPNGDIYAGAGSGIYHLPNGATPATTPTLFVSVPDGATVRQVFFDPGSSFGGKMLVTTSAGHVYTVTSAGTVALLASVGEDTEGMDIASTAFGPYAGQLLVASEGSGTIRAISNTGVVTTIATGIPVAETVSVVPLNLGSSGSSLEGFYVANYPVDIQFAAASQFSGLLGDAIVTSEDGSNARIWDLHYNSGTNSFSVSQIGNLPNQSEDGIFVTAQRIQDVGAPEPTSLLLFGSGIVGLAGVLRRKLKI